MPSVDALSPSWMLVAAVVGVAAIAFAWAVSRREVARLSGWSRRAVPALRAAAIAALCAMLVEPVLVRRSARAVRPRVVVAVDRSASMARTDVRMAAERKRRLAAALGLESEGALPEAAVARLDAMTRWQRVERLLVDSRAGLLAALRRAYDVRVVGFGERVEPLEVTADGDGGSSQLDATPSAPRTDIAAALEAIAASLDDDGGPVDGAADGALVLLASDGAHTEARSPFEVAALLRRRGVAVHCVGVGSAYEPVDVAAVDVIAPARVSIEDGARLTAVVTTRLDRDATVRASLRLAPVTGGASDRADAGLWSGERVLEASRTLRTVEWPLEIPADRLPAGRVRLELVLDALPEEATSANNRASVLVDAVRRRLRVLVVDAWPRWEVRYLKNLFARDEAVEGTIALTGLHDGELPRGEAADAFPSSREALATFDVVIVGDVPRAAFRDEELEWLRDVVGRRGGGLAFIAGAQRRLRELAGSPLEALLPVELLDRAEAPLGPPVGRRVRAAGDGGRVLSLAASGEPSDAAWALMIAPRWIDAARAAAGAEVWLEVVRDGATEASPGAPLVVARRFGAGRVVYLASDESWRWRRSIGDRYHNRVWSRLLEHLRGERFAFESERLSLDTGATMFAPGEEMLLRARLRSADGAPLEVAAVEARIAREDDVVQRFALDSSGDGAPGEYSGRLAAPAPGVYALRVAAGGSELVGELAFEVRAPRELEAERASWDEALLGRLAVETGGRFVREEDAGELVAVLEDAAREREVETRTELARTWPWLIAVVALFTAEWVLRKRGGLL